MMLKIFAIWDDKAKAFLSPFFMPQTGMAMRAFMSEVNRGPESQISLYPADYTLFEFGSFDDSKGSFQLLAAPSALGNGLAFQRVEPEVSGVGARGAGVNGSVPEVGQAKHD